MIETLVFAVVFVLVFQTRSRMGRIETRLRLLEDAVRARLQATPGDPLYQGQPVARAAQLADAPVAPPDSLEPVITVPDIVTAAVETPPIVPPSPEPAPPEPAMAMAASGTSNAATGENPDKPVAAKRPASRGWSVNFEDLFGRRLPIWAGGITLAIAGVLIVKYAVDAGLMRLLTPMVRVMAGAVFGFGLIAGAEAALRYEERVDDPRVRQTLSGAGIATLYATVLIAANVYHLIGPVVAIVILAMVTAGALALSIRFGMPSALMGLAGGLAAPAMVGSTQPNVPLLAIYLALTVAGMAGVSRMQRWAWLGIGALVGGMGWSLWIVMASGALDVLGALSLGGYVILLAIAVPLFVIKGPRTALIRSAAAIVGAAQLALMVALGGFTTVNWGLFILLAAAGQWLNRRENGFGIVPTISLALSVLLLAIWPAPPVVDFTIVGALLAVVHAGPLFERLWAVPKQLQRTIELCAVAFAIFVVPLFKFYLPEREHALGFIAIGAAAVAGAGLATGWRKVERHQDARFAWLAATGATLSSASAILLFAQPHLAVAIGLIAAATLFLSLRADDRRIERVAALFAAAALMLLAAFNDAEVAHLAKGASRPPTIDALFRWAALIAIFVGFGMFARLKPVRDAARAMGGILVYGLIAQLVPASVLPLVAPMLMVALAAAYRTRAIPTATLGAFVFLLVAWALVPAGIWIADALRSLGGVPMAIDMKVIGVTETLKRLVAPAVAMVAMLALRPAGLGAQYRLYLGTIAGIFAAVAAHILYRITFASVVGTDFVATGIAQRLFWEALLIGMGVAFARGTDVAWRRRTSIALIAAGTAHLFVYSLILHNPLWSPQHVGPLPVLNLIAPLFALAAVGAMLLQRSWTTVPARVARTMQPVIMLLVTGFAWATLRQAFHGTSLVVPGVFDAEDILRSILAIALAIGFLLWGIRTQQRDWRLASLVLMLGAVGKVFVFDASGLEGLMRIGSFVALGFSLIGIGWLYSRQLGRDEVAAR
ncbi:MAG: DUF2339 domain-containing protein [Sphingomonadales bacterium]